MFGKNKTLEAQLADAQEQITAAQSEITTLTEARDNAVSSLASASAQIEQITAERDALQSAATASSADHTAAVQSATDLRNAFRTALNLTEEQFAAFIAGDNTVIGSAVNSIATAKAVEIAASQGFPPVPTAARVEGNGKDEISREDFSALSAEAQLATVKAGTQIID